LAFDPGRPFPHISNLSLNLAVLLRDGKGAEHFARVKVPDILPQLVPVTPMAKETGADIRKTPAPQYMLWLEQLIAANLQSLFPGMEIIEAHPFHVTRDADTAIQELEAGDLMESVEEGVWQRRFADVVRLEVNDGMPARVSEILQQNLEVNPEDVYKLGQPLALSRLKHLYAVNHPELKDRSFAPAYPAGLQPEEDEDIFAAIRRQDLLLCHQNYSLPRGTQFTGGGGAA
jgi:polyphosphate kinase